MITNIVTILAATLFMEAAGESLEGKHAVASVIHHRAAKSKRSYERVCLAPKQFSCWNEGKDSALQKISKRISKNGTADWRAWQECMTIAKQMVEGKFEPSIKADHYFADWIKAPSWAKKMTKVRKIGRHTFFMS